MSTFNIILFLMILTLFSCNSREYEQQLKNEFLNSLTKFGFQKYPDTTKPIGNLDLFGRKVNDNDLKNIWVLKNLKMLSLANNEITDITLKNISTLKKLQILALNKTKITDNGVNYINKLDKIEFLFLDNTNISDTGLCGLNTSNFKVLTLSDINITNKGLKCLESSFLLEKLNLGFNKISDEGLKHIKGLINLDGLILVSTDIQFNLEVDFKNLLALNLAGTKINNESVKNINKQSRLKNLNIAYSGVNNDFIHSLKLDNLELFILRDTNINDECIKKLTHFTKLKELDIRNTKISKEGLKSLKKQLANCKIFY